VRSWTHDDFDELADLVEICPSTQRRFEFRVDVRFGADEESVNLSHIHLDHAALSRR